MGEQAYKLRMAWDIEADPTKSLRAVAEDFADGLQ